MYNIIPEKLLLDICLGIPFKHHGRDRTGLDCYGLIIFVYKQMGYALLDIDEDYDARWAWKGRNLFIENYHKQWVKVEKPGFLDVALFKNSRGVADHGGVMLDENRMLQTSRQGTLVVKMSGYVRAKDIEGYYHLRERDAK